LTRLSILLEARSIFARRGYAEASLREIAKAVGIKTPSLYAHFSSKRDLYEAVYAEVVVDHTAFFDELVLRSSELLPLARLRRLLDGVDEYYRDQPELAEFSLRAAIAEAGSDGERLREILLDSESSLAEAVRQTHDDGVADGTFAIGDAKGFTALVFVTMDGLFLQRTRSTHEAYRERFDQAWTYLTAILSANKPESVSESSAHSHPVI
jgi:AcrR family transcriptional regulator